jgi:predicted metalloprotease with PDZ domain/uncharacterized protein YbbC (DUF1343 family)
VLGQAVEPAVYTLSFPSPEDHVAVVEASLPTGGRGSVDLMLPVWSPGYYRVEDYAAQVLELSARGLDGDALAVQRIPPNRWRVEARGAPRILLSYRLLCTRAFVTANWVSPELGVLAGPATFITVAGDAKRPQEVALRPPPTWPRVATGLDSVPGGGEWRFRAEDYDALLDAPIVGGDLAVREFDVGGVPHLLVDALAPQGWDGARVALDLQKIVAQAVAVWGDVPYRRYVFLNVFRRGGGGLEHESSTLLTTNAERVLTPQGYRSWLAFATHEYVHAFNVKRLRPVELGPFDYEAPPRTPSLWLSEGVTSYLADLAVLRAGLMSREEWLASVSGTIRELQESPGRLLQTLEQSSLEVWTNSNSGVGAAPSTVSYYVKGEVVGFLLDAKIRSVTAGSRSLEDVMRLALARYGGPRGFTPQEFRAVCEEVAGVDLGQWLRSAVASTEELDYAEALDWFGLRFAEDGTWTLSVRSDATPDQVARLRSLTRPLPEPTGGPATSGVSEGAGPVTVGADRLLGEYAHLIRGKRLALVANHSARLSDGTHLADALHAYPDAELRVLFGMEFDVRSNDYSVPRDPESTVDATTGLPKHSLYGEAHKPTPEMLDGVQVIVFDIQEVGARFYEHVNVLGFVMEAAAEGGIEVVVLDRPNPITGLKMDGFVTDSAALYRFGSYAPIPVVHGMTAGELARMYDGERMLRGGKAADLHVVPMKGWKRSLWYDETGLAWRKPSPNLLTLESLLAYVGTCLFEAVNLSEGRGTDMPFEIVGAPWLDAGAAVELLNGLGLVGVTFEAEAFTPVQKPYHGRPPEMAGERLQGVRLRVTDRDAFEPYKAGVALLWVVNRLHPNKLVWNDDVLDRLVATPRLKRMLLAGAEPGEIFASWRDEVAAFRIRSAPYLLY